MFFFSNESEATFGTESVRTVFEMRWKWTQFYWLLTSIEIKVTFNGEFTDHRIGTKRCVTKTWLPNQNRIIMYLSIELDLFLVVNFTRHSGHSLWLDSIHCWTQDLQKVCSHLLLTALSKIFRQILQIKCLVRLSFKSVNRFVSNPGIFAVKSN